MLSPVHSVIELFHTAPYCAERGHESRLRQKPGELGTGFGDRADRMISAHNNQANCQVSINMTLGAQIETR